MMDMNKIPDMVHLTDTLTKRIAIESGIYDCIIDPYDKLRNGDAYSSVMPDLERFAKALLDECESYTGFGITGLRKHLGLE